jgi:hypothetical protein
VGESVEEVSLDDDGNVRDHPVVDGAARAQRTQNSTSYSSNLAYHISSLVIDFARFILGLFID